MDIPLEIRERELIVKWLKRNNFINKKFVEVGCGDGFHLEAFSELEMSGTGIDISDKALGLARKKRLKRIRILKYDFLKYQKKTELVFMLNFLEHVKNDIDYMKKANEILLKEGYLVITIPTNPKAYGYADINAGHIRRYTRTELERKLDIAGFKISHSYHIGFPVCDIYTSAFNFIFKSKKTNSKNFESGIRNNTNYYPAGFNLLSKIFFPILSFLIRLDFMFLHTKFGNHMVLFCKK